MKVPQRLEHGSRVLRRSSARCRSPEAHPPLKPSPRTATSEIMALFHNENDPAADIAWPVHADADFRNRPRLTKSP